jgi:putative serine protease PepD
MSDEQREASRDASASADGPRTDEHPVPPYPGSATPAAPYAGYPPPAAPYGAGPYGGGHPPAGGNPRPRRTGIVAAALIAGFVGGGAGFGGAYALLDTGSATPALTSAAPASTAADAVPGSVAAAAQKAMPSTVDIRVSTPQGMAEGSGVILTEDGNVLTNNHVVAGSTGEIRVTLADGSEHRAIVVGSSPSYDLAVIKLPDASGLTPATLGRSSDVRVGQQVVAIGSPQGLSGTVTTGIVSAFDRTVQVRGEDGSGVVYNGLQTDAPINQGNSGGPLVNLAGQVVGINSAIATAGGQSSGSIGLGFAIPVDQARRVAQEIMDTGFATKPLLGVQGTTAGGTGAGARIGAVQEGTPAAQAGLAAEEVVTKVGDARVEDFTDLVARIGSYAPGEQVTLTVAGPGGERTVEVTLAGQPDRAANTGSGGESTGPFGGPPPGTSPFGGGN